MRKEFVETKSRIKVKRRFPWAVVVAEAEGGYWAFESMDDYRTWKRHK